jgi:hypothetical protein
MRAPILYFCYSWYTMSAINGDKARFHRRRKQRVAGRERMQELRKKLLAAAAKAPAEAPKEPTAAA